MWQRIAKCSTMMKCLHEGTRGQPLLKSWLVTLHPGSGLRSRERSGKFKPCSKFSTMSSGGLEVSTDPYRSHSRQRKYQDRSTSPAALFNWYFWIVWCACMAMALHKIRPSTPRAYYWWACAPAVLCKIEQRQDECFEATEPRGETVKHATLIQIIITTV